MNYRRKVPGGLILLLLLILTFLAGCSGGSSGLSGASSDLSNITEISSESKNITAAQGGTVAHGAVTATFSAAILPTDTLIKVSKVSVSNSEQDPSLIDMTDTYVLSTTSATQTVELAASANIVFKINPAGFDETSIRLVVWDGYEWEEVPSSYDGTLKVVPATVGAILPFGTRIYLANPEASSDSEREGGEQIISEFVAMKVVGELLDSAGTQRAALQGVALKSTDVKPGREVFITSPKGKFKVSYVQVSDTVAAEALKNQAEEVAGYMDNAYEKIVVGMGLRSPGKTTEPNYGDAWPVELKAMKGVYGTADPGTNSIAIAIGASPGDGLSHTCHHEFTHLVQFQTLADAGNEVKDSLDWFGETMADAIGYYAQKGLGTIYCLAGESMGYFDVRLDADNHSIGRANNDNYEYRHFPFISYLLAIYKDAKFRKFFETWYSYTPGSTQISMTTIDTAALKEGSLGKSITGREGIFWDFYRDYFISGTVFNKEKFKNLPDRDSGKPLDIKEDNKEKQGVTLVEVHSGISYQKEFTIQRLAGQVAILRYKGSSPMGLTVKVSSVPGQSSGRIQMVSFKREGGILAPTGDVEEVSDGGTKTKEYTGVGSDIHDIYLVMANTSWKADDYKVTVAVTEKQLRVSKSKRLSCIGCL
jgi:hypothetical protein